MNTPIRILVAVDASAPARAAFDHALALSRARGAALAIVHAVPADQPFNRGGSARTALLAAFRQRAEGAGVAVTLAVQHGDAVGVILDHASSRRPHLIVVGTHGRTGLARLRAGSITERVVLRVGQPVLIVPEGEGLTDAARPFGRVVVGVDFSPASAAAVAQALALADRADGVTLVHVLPPPRSAGWPRAWLRAGAGAHLRRRGEVWRQLHALVPTTGSSQAPTRARVTTGDAPAEIVRIAAEIEAGLVVLGVRRRGPIGRTVFGATAIDVLRTGSRPLLVVPEGAPVASRLVPARVAA